MKFKKGDSVKVVKPEGLIHSTLVKDSTSPANSPWVIEMDAYVGNIFTLDVFDNTFGWEAVFVKDGLNWFLEDWLELTDTPSDTFDDAMSILD